MSPSAAADADAAAAAEPWQLAVPIERASVSEHAAPLGESAPPLPGGALAMRLVTIGRGTYDGDLVASRLRVTANGCRADGALARDEQRQRRGRQASCGALPRRGYGRYSSWLRPRILM